MRFRQKLTYLLIVWASLCIGVVLVWIFKKKAHETTIVLLPSAGSLVKGGWISIDSALARGHVDGLLYEGSSLGVSYFFSNTLEPSRVTALQEKYESKLINITPDSIYYLSVNKSMERLELAEIDSLYSEELFTLRRKAFFDTHTKQINRIEAFNVMRGKKSSNLYIKLSKRYAQLLVQGLYKHRDLNGNRRLVMVVDIINYHNVKKLLSNNPSIKLENEI